MKSILAALFILTSVNAQAVTTAINPSSEFITSIEGCNLRWWFRGSNDNNPIGDISWTGGCVGNKAQGFGFASKVSSNHAYFGSFSAGDLGENVFLEVTDGAITPYKLDFSRGLKVTTDNIDKSTLAKVMDQYSKMKSKNPKTGSTSKKSSGSTKKSDSSKSSTHKASSSVTPPPIAMLKQYEGTAVACTEYALGAAGNEIVNKLYSEIHAEGMCPPAKGVAKALYFSITTIEKSCSPAEIANVADMADLRSQLQEAVDIIKFSCVK
ncbi:hypothetical protein [Bdellovibrio sp. HCB209]|uniref:hypothetical protein n=1 Tax=Bdellovibrio sp. HCB209 TaxID=3394354 RepID=UPI0039B6D9B5